MDEQKDRYLGDGVYASFDGYQIWLAANHHTNKVVALDPRVLENLMLYMQDVFGLTITVKEEQDERHTETRA